MDRKTAETFAQKVRALKHLEKRITQVEKRGEMKFPWNCTGVFITIRKGDAFHLNMQTQACVLREEINALELTERSKEKISKSVPRTAPAPVGASSVAMAGVQTSIFDDIKEQKRQKKLEYQRKWNNENREKKRASDRAYQARKRALKKLEKNS